MPLKDQLTTLNGAMIAVRDLRKAIGDEEILRGVDLDVAVGETLVIIGRSGGGKAVLLKHLIGLMQPDAGEIWVAGKNITGMTRTATNQYPAKGRDSFSKRRALRFDDGGRKHRVSVARGRGCAM